MKAADKNPADITIKHDENCEQSPTVKGQIKTEQKGATLFELKELLGNDEVTGTRNWQEFRQPLDNTKTKGLE